MKRFNVVTSFPISDWESYGKAFVNSYIENWPSDVPLLCYCDGMPLPDDAPKAPNVYYIDLLECDNLVDFKARNKQFNGTQGGNGGYSFYQDVVKFSHKVFAQVEAYNAVKHEATESDESSGYLLWLDADSISFDTVTHDILEGLVDSIEQSAIGYLGRKNAYATCTSLILYNLDREDTGWFLKDFERIYNKDEVLKYQCFADNYVFDRLLFSTSITAHNWTVNCEGLDAFEVGPLGRYVMHLKGNKKYSSAAPTPNDGSTLVQELCSNIKHFKSKNIFEVGVGNLETGCSMIKAAFIESNVVHYTGCDDFTGFTPIKAARIKLEELSKAYSSMGKTLTYHLLEGNPGYKTNILDEPSVCNLYNIKPDFMYINYTNINSLDLPGVSNVVPVVILHPAEHVELDGDIPRCIIKTYGKGVEDNIKIIINDFSYPDLPTQIRVPVKVNPKDCVPPDNIQSNVRANVALFGDKQLRSRYHWHGTKVALVSGGPSIKDHLKDIRKLQDEGAFVICVKHSHNYLIENGIIPWACVILDPRPFSGVSTHGKVRRDLLANPHKDVKYLIASMTNQDVIKHLIDSGADVVGWHAYTTALEGMDELKNTTLVTGGTCSAMRGLGLMHTLGFRDFHIFGMDCCHEGIPEDLEELDMYGNKKWLKSGVTDSKLFTEEIFYTTGELLALAQDFEMLLDRQHELDIDIHVYGRGMAKSIMNGSSYKPLPEFNKDTFYMEDK